MIELGLKAILLLRGPGPASQGQNVSNKQSPRGMVRMRNKLVVALLAFFLGGLGAHKFYLGQTGWGFLYLIFFWTLIPSLAAFVKFFILLPCTDASMLYKNTLKNLNE